MNKPILNITEFITIINIIINIIILDILLLWLLLLLLTLIINIIVILLIIVKQTLTESCESRIRKKNPLNPQEWIDIFCYLGGSSPSFPFVSIRSLLFSFIYLSIPLTFILLLKILFLPRIATIVPIFLHIKN